MLDLKAQLAAAGLVSEADIKAAEAQKRGSKRSSKNRGASPQRAGAKPPTRGAAEAGGRDRSLTKPRRVGLDRGTLAAAGKGERYTMIRAAVAAQRLDSSGPIPSASAEPFHFAGEGGIVGRVFVEPAIQARLVAGSAAIVAFMSNHGLAHAVIPAPLAREIAAVFPEWLRLLQGEAEAGAETGAEPDPPAEGGAPPG